MSGDDIQSLLTKNPIVSACLVIAVLAIAWIVLRTDPIPQYKSEIEAMNREIRFMDQNKKEGTTLKADVEKMSKIATDIGTRLMSAADTTENLSYFFNLEQASNTTIGDPVQFEPVHIEDKAIVAAFDSVFSVKPVYIGYEMSINGVFSDVLSYLQSMISGNYFTRVQAFSMEPTRDGSSISLNVSFEVLGKER